MIVGRVVYAGSKLARQQGIQRTLARRHLTGSILVLKEIGVRRAFNAY